MSKLHALTFTLLVSVLLLCSCASQTADKPTPLQYASLLSIEQTDSFALVHVADPWNKGQTLANYVLVPDSLPLPHNLPQGEVVRTPLKRAVITSSVHAALLLDLGAETQMAGITDVNYIVSPRVKGFLQSHPAIKNLGAAITPDIERYKAVQTDGVLVSPFQGTDHGALSHSGFTLIECADYMETSPLGRAEWMRFYGLLFGKEQRADSLFAQTAQQYQALKQQVAQSKAVSPTVMCDLKMGNTWYQPGGASTMGQFIKDAGGHYLWADQAESGSLPLDMERVFARANHADIWLIKYGQATDMTYRQMQRDCSQYAQFKAWQQHHIYGCNTFQLPFFEEVPFHPDWLLSNLINVFKTAQVSTTHTYYTPLK